ncbi:MAG: cation diffusion facilitator family transporter [Candidatus Omnitrophota bacterium]|jgi:cation diffusion facilitator family transporter
MKDEKLCRKCAKITSSLGFIAAVFLSIFKLTFGFMGRSHALVASGMSNVSDIGSSMVVFLGMKYTHRPATRGYPYGFGKIEFIAQVGISGAMIAGTIALIASSFIHMNKQVMVIPHMLVFFVSIISSVISALVYKFSNCGARQLNSPTLRSHAEHNKIDVYGSLLVAVGVLATRIGIHWADPVIAIFESIHIIHGSYAILTEGLKGMMDASAPKGYIEEVKKSVLQIDEVDNVTQVLARSSGSKMILDLTVEINPDLSVLESKNIVQNIKADLRKRDRYMGSILVQIKPTPMSIA